MGYFEQHGITFQVRKSLVNRRIGDLSFVGLSVCPLRLQEEAVVVFLCLYVCLTHLDEGVSV